MARNVEIKAKVRNAALLRERALELATAPPREIHQHDVFYHTHQGRLKLRCFPDGSGDLIAYRRTDMSGPKTSHYRLYRTSDAAALGVLLTAALRVRGEVRKVRTLIMTGRTRIHLDSVVGLGDFLELEVVLAEDETAADGEREATALMECLGVAPDDLIAGAYLDLQEERGVATDSGAAPS